MSIVDDIRALRARTDQVQTDADALLATLSGALEARLRPLPALAWLPDEVLHEACVAFAQSAIQGVTRNDAPRPASPGRSLI